MEVARRATEKRPPLLILFLAVALSAQLLVLFRDHQLHADAPTRSKGEVAGLRGAITPDFGLRQHDPLKAKESHKKTLGTWGGTPDNDKVQKAIHESIVWQSKEARELKLARQKLNLRVRYGPLFKQLKLSGDEKERFSSLLLDSENLGDDLNRALSSQGLNPQAALEIAHKAVPAAQQQMRQQLEEFLGPERLKTYDFYESHIQAFMAVAAVEQALASQGKFLAESQREQLTSTLLNSKQDIKPAMWQVSQSEDAQVAVDSLKFVVLAGNRIYIDGLGTIHPNFTPSDTDLRTSASFLYPEQLAALEGLRSQSIAAVNMATAFSFK